MKTKISLMIIALTLVFSSCEREDSADVNQDRIYTIYNLIYEAEQDITYARAWFRFGSFTGTLLELTSPSHVSCNGQTLAFKNAFAYYEKSFAGLVSAGDFLWEDYDGLVFENSVQIQSIAFPASITEIDGSQAYELTWVGQALGTNEYVAVAINGDFESDFSIITEDSPGSTSIVIPSTALSELPKDHSATFWLEFGTNPDLAESTGAGGEIYGKYRVKKQIMIR